MFSRLLFAGGIILMCAQTAMCDTVYISDNPEIIFNHEQSWGALGLNTATHSAEQTPQQIKIGDKVYEKGIGTHANSDMSILLDGKYKSFDAEIGLHKDPSGQGSVIFRVYVDGVEKYSSGILKQTDGPIPISIPVHGAYYLHLIVNDAKDGITCDASNWANARLTPDENAVKLDFMPSIDIAPFAKIVTSDPKRIDGATANRLQEFKPEDVFLESELFPNKSKMYNIPSYEGGQGCIGLLWTERRFPESLSITFAGKDRLPSTKNIQLQYWSSQGRVDNDPHWGIVAQTEWQGKWEPLPGKLEKTGNGFNFDISDKVPELSANGILKIRWIMPVINDTPAVKSFSAISKYHASTVSVRLSSDQAKAGESAKIDMYNGYILKNGKRTKSCRWKRSEPIDLDIVYTQLPATPDMTAFRISSGKSMFTVAVEDIIRSKQVYIPDHGFFAALANDNTSIEQYKQKIAGRKTILEKVREMPDQTFASAKSKLFNPINNTDPMLVSLACDNNKFFVRRDGVIQFESHPDNPAPAQNLSYSREIKPVFGTGSNIGLTRKIESSTSPVPITEVVDNGIRYTQRFYVAPAGEPVAGNPYLNTNPLGVAEFTITNESDMAQVTSLSLSMLHNKWNPESQKMEQSPLADFQSIGDNAVAEIDGNLLAYLRKIDKSPLKVSCDKNNASISGRLMPSEKVVFVLYIPKWNAVTDEYSSLADYKILYQKTQEYWQRLLADGMKIDIPEPLMRDVFHANQMHILLAARNEDNGRLAAPWAASSVYGPLDTEAQAPTLAMGLLGFDDFTRRCHEYFLSKYNDQGYLANGYTIMGTGQHLWTLGEYYKLTKDKEWLRKYSDQLNKSCVWISDQRRKTMKPDADGKKMPEYGFMPPGVIADWDRYAYYFYTNGFYYAGLKAAVSALSDIGYKDATKMLKDTEEFRKDILKGYVWNRDRMPALPLSDGTYMTPYPSSLYCFGLTKFFYKGASSIGHDVEVGGHNIVTHGIIDPRSRDAELMTEYMEDEWFLMYHWLSAYDEGMMKKDWFNYGGFSKLQPYYTRNADIYAMRDDIKPYIRTCFNTFFPMLSMETLALWEHFNAQGGWNKTHETGWMLQQIRMMLVQERDKELWLAPFVTYNWLKDGMSVGIDNAPTYFGRVSYKITSHIDKGYIEASITPPSREKPETLVLRLRHPDGKKIKLVTVNGTESKSFDNKLDVIRIKPTGTSISVRVNY
ncbi:MAG: NPCBM/NEW2 domain-containing protein [Armatimonadota bacterium]